MLARHAFSLLKAGNIARWKTSNGNKSPQADAGCAQGTTVRNRNAAKITRWTTPTTASGAPAAATPASTADDSSFASPTTDSIRNNASYASPLLGGGACGAFSSSAAFCGSNGKK